MITKTGFFRCKYYEFRGKMQIYAHFFLTDLKTQFVCACYYNITFNESVIHIKKSIIL